MLYQLTVSVHHAYGRKIIRPECRNSRTFCSLAGTQTLTTEHVNMIKRLGFKFEVVNKEELSV